MQLSLTSPVLVLLILIYFAIFPLSTNGASLLGRSAQDPDPFESDPAHRTDTDPDAPVKVEVTKHHRNPCLGTPSIGHDEDDEEESDHTKKKDCPEHVDFSEHVDETFLSPELTSHLTALSSKYTKRIYPPRPVLVKAIQRYAELPYYVPVGPSLFFCSLFLVLGSWYMSRILTAALRSAAKKVDLHPEIQEFPKINQYSLQQSKREAGLRREARNTWAWMAKKYLLMQNDPKVNFEIFRTTWSDFDLPKDVWGTVRSVLKAGAWIGKTKERLQGSVQRALSKDKVQNKDTGRSEEHNPSDNHLSVTPVKKTSSENLKKSGSPTALHTKSPSSLSLPKISGESHTQDKDKDKPSSPTRIKKSYSKTEQSQTPGVSGATTTKAKSPSSHSLPSPEKSHEHDKPSSLTEVRKSGSGSIKKSSSK